MTGFDAQWVTGQVAVSYGDVVVPLEAVADLGRTLGIEDCQTAIMVALAVACGEQDVAAWVESWPDDGSATRLRATAIDLAGAYADLTGRGEGTQDA